MSSSHILLQRVRRRFNSAVRTFSLIGEGDHILLGLSGGKDSLALLQLLGEMRRKRNFSFRITAIHVRIKSVDYLSSTDYLREQCNAAGATFLLREADFQKDTKTNRTPCFLCSWTRRKQLFEVAQELGCNKIALGHHYDDVIRTALMNLTFSGSFSSMPPELKMDKMPLSIIRPLCRIAESDLSAWALHHNYQTVIKKCPHECSGNRHAISALTQAMEQLNPEYRESIWHALMKTNEL